MQEKKEVERLFSIVGGELATAIADEELLTVAEAAQVTRLSVAWWRQAIFQRKVRFVKLSRRVLIPRSTVRQLIRGGTVEPRNVGGKGA